MKVLVPPPRRYRAKSDDIHGDGAYRAGQGASGNGTHLAHALLLGPAPHGYLPMVLVKAR